MFACPRKRNYFDPKRDRKPRRAAPDRFGLVWAPSERELRIPLSLFVNVSVCRAGGKRGNVLFHVQIGRVLMHDCIWKQTERA